MSSVAWAIERYWSEDSEGRIHTVPLVITLHVHPMEFVYARREIAQKLNGELPPQLNVVIDHDLEREEWYIEAPDIPSMGAYGSLLK